MNYRTITFLILSIALPAFLFGQEVANIERYQGIEDAKSVNAIVVDTFNNKWIGTDQGLFKISSFYKPVENVTSESAVKALAKNRGGDVWAGREDLDVISVDLRNKGIIDAEEIEITSMMVDDKWLWVGTNNGIYTVSLSTYEVASHYTTENSKLGANQINVLHRDRFGVKWIGTDRGLTRIKDNEWKTYNKQERFTAIGASVEGIWVVSNRDIYQIYKDRNQDRWVPLYVERKLSVGDVHGITSDSKGRIYIASKILVQYNPYDEVINKYDEESGYVDAEALSIAADKNDDIWVGTAERGLFRIEFTDELIDKLVVLVNVEKKLDCSGASDGEVKLKIKGGITPYKIVWNKPHFQGDHLRKLQAGVYAVTVSDAEGAFFVNSTTLTEPAPVGVTVIENERISSKGMKDGKAAIEVTGGTPDFTYLWDNGSTIASARRLPAGDHRVSVTDAKGCATVAKINIKKEKVIPDLIAKKLEIGQTLRVNQLFFEADSTIITKESYVVLNEVQEFLSENPNIKIEIGGHTNSLPADEYCDRLSTARAKNVTEYLHKLGIPKAQVSYQGYGKRVPVASNRTEAGRKRNQRVEIKILSLNG